MKSNRSLCIIYFLFMLLGLTSVLSANQGEVPGQFIIKFNQTAKPAKIASNLSASSHQVGLQKLAKQNLSNSPNSDIQNYYLFHSSDSTLQISDVRSIIGDQNIAYIEPNYYLEFFDFPNDSLFANQWYLQNVGQMYLGIERNEGNMNDLLVLKSGTVGADLGLTDYYTNTPTDKTKIVVAIIDSGVDITHPELQGQFWKNIDEIPLNGIDDDHNGYIDDTLGYDVSGDSLTYFDQVGDNDPTDLVGHGSHIAGIIGAKKDSKGIAGVAPNALLMPIKVYPSFTSAIAAEAIFYAVDNGADIISISWGSQFESIVLRDALNYARAQNVFVSIAAGNTGGTDRFYPQAFDSSFVVAASNSDGYLTYFTTYGAHIDITAPGEDILSIRGAGTDLYEATEPGLRIIGDDSLYILADGTSMSAPMVAGAAALLLALKPELSVPELEQILIDGATDIVNPFNEGENLVGYDTLSGHGSLNIDNSIALLQPEGIAFESPAQKGRYTSEVPVKVIASGGYDNLWSLSYRLNQDTLWTGLANGTSIPFDSILINFDTTFESGHYYFRLEDVYGNKTFTDFYFVHSEKIELTSPIENEIVNFDVLIEGTVFGMDFDSLVVIYKFGGVTHKLMSSTKEFYNTNIYNWKISGVDPGEYILYLYGFYNSNILSDSVIIQLNSVFAEGWPQSIGVNSSLSPIVADLNKDNQKELYVPSGAGLFGFTPTGEPLPGFPALPGIDVRCMPAVYDVTRDGNDEIIITSDSGIYVVKYDGTIADGWPQYCQTGLIPFGHGFPNPTVTQLGLGEDSAIMIINTIGEILAYEFNGNSYFYSLEGLFTTVNSRLSDSYAKGGKISPYVTSLDINDDGLYEVLSSYTSPPPYTGVGLYEGRTGLPLLSDDDPLVIVEQEVLSTAVADFNNDNSSDIVSLGKDSLGMLTLWVKSHMTEDLAGWPVPIEDLVGWFISPITLADLNLDGKPEVMFTAFWYDIAHLFIFNSDGTPYRQLLNAPVGVCFSYYGTMGIPISANVYGDEKPEMIFRSGYVLPGSGPEMLHIMDNELNPIPGWPAKTPALFNQVFSKQYAPLVDDLDSDGKVELVLLSDNYDILVWDFDAPYDNGKNKFRYLADNLNSNQYKLNSIATDIHDGKLNLPERIALYQNYPNPFNPTTTISFELPRREDIKLTVYNILGQVVENILDENYNAGFHRIEFDADSYASGIYLYKLETEEKSITKKMVLIK